MIGLDEVAPDAVALIAAFREAGGRSFGSAPVEAARVAYRASCLGNGLPTAPVARVDDVRCPVAGGEITLRVYRPAHAAAASAAIVFLHGGGWALGDLDTHDSICRTLVATTDLPLVAIDYRLAPEHPFPVPLEDCRDAIALIRDLAAGLGIDPLRLVVVGDSAGGNLAAVLATDTRLAVDGTRIVGQALLYPVTDLSTESAAYGRIAEGFPLTASSMRWFARLYLGPEGDAADPRVSPLLLDGPATAPPLFIVTLGLDPLGDEGVAYAGRSAMRGTRVEHHHLPQHAHGIFTSAGRIPTGKDMLMRTAQFIREVTA